MKRSKMIAVVLTATLLSACTDPNSAFNKQNIGTAAGAIGGGVIGSTMGHGIGKTATTIGGALIGGLLGNSVGKSLDNGDRAAGQ